MNLQRAFPICGVRITSEGGGAGDEYRITSSSPERLAVECPRSALRHPPPARGRTVLLESRMPDAIYRLRARVEAVEAEDAVVLRLVPLGALDRVQRRGNFRVAEEYPLKLRIDPPVRDAPAREISLTTSDVSAGGARLRTKKPIEVGSTGNVAISFPEAGYTLNCRARVVRCLPMSGGRFDVGLLFTNLLPGDQDRVVRVLMDAMRRKVRL
jgi:c-di-GMP-binding flagellar brake protein YcgR